MIGIPVRLGFQPDFNRCLPALWQGNHYPFFFWRDLDDAETLADLLDQAGYPEDGDASYFVGDSTFNPFGFSLPQLTHLFYQVKSLRIDGTFSDPDGPKVGGTTRLRQSLSFWPSGLGPRDRRNFPTGGGRLLLGCNVYDSHALILPNELESPGINYDYGFICGALGFIYQGKYWPQIATDCSDINGVEGGVGGSTVYSFTGALAGAPVAGTFTFLGQTTNLYEAYDPGAGATEPATGDITVTVEEEF